MARKSLKEERLGEINISNEGYKMKIIKYNEYSDILVEFQDKHKAIVRTNYNSFKNGSVKNPYHPRVFGVGYLGQGKYEPYINGKSTKCYIIWCSMLQRCYDPYYINRYLTYKDCYVCDEWLCFQNFAKWYYENYYECNGETMHLDKDILCKGNKIYSPETCVFVPNNINQLFVKSNKSRGNYPIGVCWHKNANKFQAYCGVLDKNGKNKIKYLGLYNTSKEAFLAYKTFKESYIKQVTDEYKDLISQKLYDVLYKYEVEIND